MGEKRERKYERETEQDWERGQKRVVSGTKSF